MKLLAWLDESTDAEFLRIRELIARELYVYIFRLLLVGAVVGVVLCLVAELESRRLFTSAMCLFSVIFATWFTRNWDARARVGTLMLCLSLVLVGATIFNGGVYSPAFNAFFIVLSIQVWYMSLTRSLVFCLGFTVLGVVSTWLENSGVVGAVPAISHWQYLCFMALFMVTCVLALHLIQSLIFNTLRGLNRSDILLKTIYGSVDEALLIYSREMNLVESNQSGKDFLSRLKQHQQASLNEQCPDTGSNPIGRYIQTSEIKHPSIPLNIGASHFEVNSAPLLINGEVDGHIIRAREVTEQVRQRRQLAQIDKVNTIGQITSSVIHDFGNTLMTLRGVLDYIEADQTEAQREWIELMGATILSAQADMRQLMSIVKNEGDPLEAVSLNHHIERSMKLVRGSIDIGIKLHLQLDARNEVVNTDANALINALINLGMNAAHAIGQQGTIKISTEDVVLSQADAELTSPPLIAGSYTKVSIQDDGKGISPETISQIFKPFFTTKEEMGGTGLGLMAVHHLMERSHGGLTVHSQEEEGTRFDLFFPSREVITSTS